MACVKQPLALVTGAAQRLGATMARSLHAQGYDLAVHYHTSSVAARALVRELNALRAGSAFALRQNLAGRHAGARLINALAAKVERLDLLVNNASIFDRTPLDKADVTAWERIQAINVR